MSNNFYCGKCDFLASDLTRLHNTVRQKNIKQLLSRVNTAKKL